MKIKFKNINPCKFYDELLSSNILPILVEHDCKKGEYIAENIWITFNDDVDVTKVNDIVAKHNPSPVIKPTTEEALIKELATMKIDNLKKDVMMTNALQTIASLKVQVMNLKGGTV